MADNWGRRANIATVIGVLAALIFSGYGAYLSRVSFQKAESQAAEAIRASEFARQQSLAAQLSQFAELVPGCEQPIVAGSATPYSPLDAWRELCRAREIAHEVLIHDLLLQATHGETTLLNALAVKEVSEHLEDALVRELLSAAERIQVHITKQGVAANDDPCRMQRMLMSLYLYVHPHATVGGNVQAGFAEEVRAHISQPGAHDQRVMKLREAVQAIGPLCGAAKG